MLDSIVFLDSCIELNLYIAVLILHNRFLDKNSSGLLPVLRDGETWIQDSDAIIDHLCSKYVEESEPFKTPQDIKERAKQM